MKMPSKALLVIDVQEGIVSNENYPMFNSEILIENINQLIQKSRAANIPVIFVRHNDDYIKFGSPEWELHSKLKIKESDQIVDKKTPDSFFKTDLQDILESDRIEEIYICGLQTDYCIDTTCRSAFAKNFKTVLVEDAHSTCDSETLNAEQIINHHNKIIGNWFAKLIKTENIFS